MQSHIFDDGISLWRSKRNTERFIFENTDDRKLTEFTEFLSRGDMMPIVEVTINLHRNDKRKITGDPVLKHLFYSTYLGFISPEFQKYDESEKRTMLAISLLHDSIELRRKTNSKYCEYDLYRVLEKTSLTDFEKRKVVTAVSLLTPPVKSKNVEENEKKWLKAKLENFKRIIEMKTLDVAEKDHQIYLKYFKGDFGSLDLRDYTFLLEVIKIIEISDEIAKVRETTDDLQTEMDGDNVRSNGIKPLSWRYKDHLARLLLFQIYFKEHQSIKQQINDLVIIYDYLEKKESVV